jgi:hypothetical protein
MNNSVTLLISGLVFLFAGLWIGKNSERNNVRLITTTNIIEKPVEVKVYEYINEGVKNQGVANVASDSNSEVDLGTILEKATPLANIINSIPPGIEDASIDLDIPKDLENSISKNPFKEILEYELRKIGIRIDVMSDNNVYFSFKTLPVKNQNFYCFQSELKFSTKSYIFQTNKSIYIHFNPIWVKGYFGIANDIDKSEKEAREQVNDLIRSLCIEILKSKKK